MKLDLKGKNIFYFGFISITSRIKRLEKQMIKTSGFKITPKMLIYVAILETHPNISNKELLSILDIKKGTLSNMVKILMHKNILIKKVNKTDKRKTELSLTDVGKKIAKLNNKIRERVWRKLSQNLTSKEINDFILIAKKMFASI